MPRKKSPSKRRGKPDAMPPSAFRHNWLAWRAGCDLAGGLNSLPIGVNLPGRRVPPAFRKYVAEAGPPLPLDHFPPDLLDAWKVVEVLLTEGHTAACHEFNRRFGSSGLPLLSPGEPRHSARKVRKGAALIVPDLRRPTFYPPALCLWLILWEPEAHPRLLRCDACRQYFFARSRHQTCQTRVYCSGRCKTRKTVADSRRRPKM